MTEMVSTGEAEDVTDTVLPNRRRPRWEISARGSNPAPLGVVALACGKTMSKEARSRMVLDTGR